MPSTWPRRSPAKVLGYEAYNEPNLWPYIYPQRTAADASFAAHLYLQYLKAFSAGVKAGDPGAKVIAGATAPTGTNSSTGRARSRSLAPSRRPAGRGTSSVYSHHPYVPGGPGDMDPRLPPQHPNHTVSLSNIGTLLKIFPGKPFYLTEYGFSTEPSVAFGPAVTEFQQAAFLGEAYALAARHAQIKMLVWQPRQDTLAERQGDRPERLLPGAAPGRRHGQTGLVCLRRRQPHCAHRRRCAPDVARASPCGAGTPARASAACAASGC